MNSQAINTEYRGATDRSGSRIIARAAAGYVVEEYDDALNENENHEAAARKLAERFKWRGVYVCGTLRDGTRVFVCAKRSALLEFADEVES